MHIGVQKAFCGIVKSSVGVDQGDGGMGFVAMG